MLDAIVVPHALGVGPILAMHSGSRPFRLGQGGE